MTEPPLLALTRGGDPTEATAAQNMRQLIQLRWLAVAGQLVTILTVGPGLGVRLPLPEMLGVVALLALVNVIGTATLRRGRAVTGAETLLALLFDIGTLTAQLYLSGGATNPFIPLYLVQVALGAILLEGWAVAVLVAVTCLSYALLTVRHRPLLLPDRLSEAAGDLHLLGNWLSFALVAVLLVLFVTRIGRNLRARDAHVAALRARAVEEDAIVRMGLFASGAAHELGTPLASLSVILSDWRRLPHIAADAELMGEIGEMQAEVQRCKKIVSDILHSAGEPRGDAMERVAARSFLREVADTWRTGQPGVRLSVDLAGLGDATLVAEPALRQAIGSLLDNAAEASPEGIALHGFRDESELVIAIADRGPGFPPAMLGAIGRPLQSNKGAGHGVGLFLASNVARRLGGRIEARNGDRGAEVRLVLPLASA